MSLFERFEETKEAGFRELSVRPLLERMGFVGISHEHGANEFGKDFVFSELDRFGKLRHMAIQAKHEETINQGRKVDDLLSQIKQAFTMPYRLATCPDDARFVSAVYVFNTGSITSNAKALIVGGLERPYASNTHFFGGDELATLDRTAALSSTQEALRRLTGLKNQMELNYHVWTTGLESIRLESPQIQARDAMYHAIEEMLTYPIAIDGHGVGPLELVWQRAKIINFLRRSISAPQPQNDTYKNNVVLLESNYSKCLEDARSCLASISAAIEFIAGDRGGLSKSSHTTRPC